MAGRNNESFLVGLIGTGLQASRTPFMHEQEGSAQGLRYLYRLIDLESLGLTEQALPELLTAAERMGFAGLNITHPCKQAVIPFLSELSTEARAIGAVNTVVLREGSRVGHNTDWWGFAESFRRGLPGAAMEAVVLLGAGGAGAAVAHAILALGASRVFVFDIETRRSQALAAALGDRFGTGRATVGGNLKEAIAHADGLIHATPTGMAKYPGLPLPAEYLRSSLWVAEVVYFPLETPLLKRARVIGCRTLDGAGMAVFQAVEAFRLFTGLSPDAERMRRYFYERDTTATMKTERVPP